MQCEAYILSCSITYVIVSDNAVRTIALKLISSFLFFLKNGKSVAPCFCIIDAYSLKYHTVRWTK
jgi:hypothetical protein